MSNILIGYLIEKIDAKVAPLLEKGVDIQAIMVSQDLADEIVKLCGSMPSKMQTVYFAPPIPIFASSQSEDINFIIKRTL